MSGFQCPECRKRGKPWPGDDPVCAFDEGGQFTPDNFACATMLRLRNDADWRRRNDDFGSLAVKELGDGYVVLSFYKARGRTPLATFFRDDDAPRPLLLSDVYPAEEVSES